MNFARIATYAIQPGNTDEITRRVTDKLVPLYKQQPGFESLSVVDAGEHVLSISRWDSDQHARDGGQVGTTWAKQQSDILTASSLSSYFGTEIVSVEAVAV